MGASPSKISQTATAAAKPATQMAGQAIGVTPDTAPAKPAPAATPAPNVVITKPATVTAPAPAAAKPAAPMAGQTAGAAPATVAAKPAAVATKASKVTTKNVARGRGGTWKQG
jgi:hypothetical protein